MARVFVGVGSNLDRERSIRGALRALRGRFGSLDLSSVYESPAAGFDGPPFLNLVAGFQTGLSPSELVAALKAIESAQGRSAEHRGFASRPVDLDLLRYGDLTLEEGRLRLPAQDILEYAFVCLPLAELCGDWVHPGAGRRLEELCAENPDAGRLRRVDLDLGP